MGAVMAMVVLVENVTSINWSIHFNDSSMHLI